MLTQEQVQAFGRDGFIAVRQAVDRQTLKGLRDAADELVEQSRTVAESNALFDIAADHSAACPRLNRVSHPVTQQAIFWETATSAALLDCVAQLIGEHIRFHHSKLNMKTARGGSEIGWHQDFAFFPHTNWDLVACGIALDDSTPANGCLLVVPGTHRLGVLNHRDGDGEFVGRITTDLDAFDADAAVPVALEAGDMSIHHAAAVHGSLQNQSESQRRLLIFQYAACDAIQLDRRPPANSYAERVVRGLPPTHARMAGAISLPLRGDTTGARSIFERQRAKVG